MPILSLLFRILVTSSALHEKGEINWDDPNFTSTKYSAFAAFNQSKLANVLFTKELGKRIDGTGITT
jgi:retinol dehydrogenase-13